MKTLFSLIESSFPPDFPDLHQELGIVAERFDSARNLHRALQKRAPDFFVGEFVYGWGNDNAGATVSNLDVTLRTLQAVAPQAKGNRGHAIERGSPHRQAAGIVFHSCHVEIPRRQGTDACHIAKSCNTGAGLAL